MGLLKPHRLSWLCQTALQVCGLYFEHCTFDSYAPPMLINVTANVQDRIGIDVELLDEMQKSILGLYRTPATPSQAVLANSTNLDAIQDSINGLCSASIQSALYKAAGQLLDDLHRNVRLLGTPERCVVFFAHVKASGINEHAQQRHNILHYI